MKFPRIFTKNITHTNEKLIRNCCCSQVCCGVGSEYSSNTPSISTSSLWRSCCSLFKFAYYCLFFGQYLRYCKLLIYFPLVSLNGPQVFFSSIKQSFSLLLKCNYLNIRSSHASSLSIEEVCNQPNVVEFHHMFLQMSNNR